MDNEDTAILDYFKDKKSGFYVDVGCYHPIHRNNTYLLHKQNLHDLEYQLNSIYILHYHIYNLIQNNMIYLKN